MTKSGFAPRDDTGTQLLFRLVSAAYERRSLLAIASHWSFETAAGSYPNTPPPSVHQRTSTWPLTNQEPVFSPERFGWQQPLLTDLDGSPLAVVTAHRPKNVAGSWAWLVGVVEQVHPQNPSLYAAAGGVATTLASLPRSRSEAEELSLLMDKRALHGPSCRLEDAWATVTLARASAGIRVESGLLGGPLPAILAHDADHGTDYSRTLATYLDHFGEPQRAALALHIHPNTLRYRMHRLADVTPIDLTSPQVRLALRLQLAALN